MKETDISEEELEVLEIGDNAARWLNIETIKKPVEFTLTKVTAAQTDWGIKATLYFHDDFDEFKLSSWNYLTKQSIKPKEAIGKKIRLSPKDDKKVLLELL